MKAIRFPLCLLLLLCLNVVQAQPANQTPLFEKRLPRPSNEGRVWFKPWTWFYKPPLQDKVATVHFSVTGGVPWEVVSKDLETQFSLNEAKALEEVLPITGGAETEFVDALRFAGKIAANATETPATLDPTKVPATEPFNPAANLRPAAGSTTLPAPRENALGVDPFMKYRTAQALFQSVKMLNRVVKDAKSSHGSKAYLLTLQISLMPYQQNQPFDAYTDFSFFLPATGTTSASGSGKDVVPVAPLYTGPLSGDNPSVSPFLNMQLFGAMRPDLDAFSNSLAGIDKTPSPLAQVGKESPYQIRTATTAPEIVPLLVTDNVESSTYRGAARTIRQFTLAAMVSAPQIAGSGELNKYTDELQRVIGEDYNSLLTVAKLSRNIFRVRIGANRQGSAKYGLVPQTHKVYVLVLVPDAEAGKIDRLTCYSMTRLKDRNTGIELRMRDEKALNQAYGRALYPLVDSGFLKDDVLKPDVAREMFVYYTANQYPALRTKAGEYLNPKFVGSAQLTKETQARMLDAATQTLWLHLSQVWSGSVYSGDTVELAWPANAPDPTPPDEGKWILMDDGSKSIIRVPGYTHLPAGTVQQPAFLELHDAAQRQLLLNATKRENEGSNVLLLEFPSISALLALEQFKEAPVKLHLKEPSATGGITVAHLSTKTPPQPPKVSLSCSATDSIVITKENDKAVATADLSIDTDRAKGWYLHVVGAGISTIAPLAENDVNPPLTAVRDGVYQVNGLKARVSLKLNNVAAGKIVEFVLRDSADDTATKKNAAKEFRLSRTLITGADL